MTNTEQENTTMSDDYSLATIDQDGNVRETLTFEHCNRADYAATLERAGFTPSELWNLSVATLAMMSRDVMRHG